MAPLGVNKNSTRDQISSHLHEWWQKEGRSFPWRKRLPLWKALMTEVMLQRTRAEQVQDSFKVFDRRFPTAASLSGISEEHVASIFAPLGLKWRISVFVQLAEEIVSQKGRLPRTVAELRTLPGIGDYAASAALSMHGNVRAVIIDSNTVRILSRLAGVEFGPETRRKRWVNDALDELTPVSGFREFNYSLLDLGALVCTPKNPKCSACPIAPQCETGRTRTSN